MENYNLQYASDIHLEKAAAPFNLIIEPVAPDLALCGDIGDPYSQIYSDFLKWCSMRWTRVFVLTGNHEYFLDKPDFNKTIEKVDEHISKLCEKIGPNVFFLQKGVFLIQEHKIAILGATLWSAPDIRRWDMMVDGMLGDPGLRGEYNAIYKVDENTGLLRCFHPSDVINIHMEHKHFITKTVGPYSDLPKGYRVIVLTHHMPTYSLNSAEFSLHPLRSTYASDQDALMKEPIVAWICGHSHDPRSIRFEETGTLVTLNPLGYKNQSKDNYSRTATVVVHRENFATIRN
jgi:DNA repair exonuclease SbcCD nuclease subunit